MSQQQQDLQPPPANAPATTTTPSPTPPAPRRRHLPQVLVAKILTLVLQNGVAMAQHQPRPRSVAALNALRTELLLHSPFFDPEHHAAELEPRTRRSAISFTDLVVLLARLMRVLMKQGELTAGEGRERLEVRRECLDLPFFDRGLVGSETPFADDEGFTDEACVV